MLSESSGHDSGGLRSRMCGHSAQSVTGLGVTPPSACSPQVRASSQNAWHPPLPRVRCAVSPSGRCRQRRHAPHAGPRASAAGRAHLAPSRKIRRGESAVVGVRVQSPQTWVTENPASLSCRSISSRSRNSSVAFSTTRSPVIRELVVRSQQDSARPELVDIHPLPKQTVVGAPGCRLHAAQTWSTLGRAACDSRT